MIEKYYLSIKKNKNNVNPLYVNMLNNGKIPDNIKKIDTFTSKFKDEEELKNDLIATNAYNEFDLDGILVIAKYIDENGKLVYSKKFIDKIVFDNEKNTLKNITLFKNIKENIDNREFCNHIYNKFNNTDNQFFKKFVSLFNNKAFLDNFELCEDNLKNLIMELTYEEKRKLSLFITEEINKNILTKKEKKLELVEKGV